MGESAPIDFGEDPHCTHSVMALPFDSETAKEKIASIDIKF